MSPFVQTGSRQTCEPITFLPHAEIVLRIGGATIAFPVPCRWKAWQSDHRALERQTSRTAYSSPGRSVLTVKGSLTTSSIRANLVARVTPSLTHLRPVERHDVCAELGSPTSFNRRDCRSREMLERHVVGAALAGGNPNGIILSLAAELLMKTLALRLHQLRETCKPAILISSSLATQPPAIVTKLVGTTRRSSEHRYRHSARHEWRCPAGSKRKTITAWVPFAEVKAYMYRR